MGSNKKQEDGEKKRKRVKREKENWQKKHVKLYKPPRNKKRRDKQTK
jgi:hypothetical protein